MNYEQLETRVSQVLRDATDHASAIAELSACLEQSLGGEALLVIVPRGRAGKKVSIARYAEQFFSETTALPYRSLYTVSLSLHGREWGRLVAFFAWGCSHEGAGQSLVKRIGEEFETLLGRTRVHLESAA